MEHQGLEKVRFLRSGTNYKIQYADLKCINLSRKIISKDNNYNFVYFSINSGTTLTIEPYKTNWDLNFTTFTNYVNFGTEVTLWIFRFYYIKRTWWYKSIPSINK